MRTLGRDDVLRLLAALGDDLASLGIRGRMFIVGGAAMALAFQRDRLTRDVDAIFEPKTVVYEAARRVASANGLDDDWLNDAVKGLLPGDDPDATTQFVHDGLVVQVASPRYLFTMKALAARFERDGRDLITLYRACGFDSVEEALDHVAATAPPHLITPKVTFFVQELIQ